MDEPLAKPSPWHRGERLMQQRVGVAEQMEAHGSRMIRDFLTEQHRAFFPLLPFIAVGSVDARGAPWAGLIEGVPGFINSPDDKTLHIGAPSDRDDPATAGIAVGAAVGLLGIQLHTRRRNRLNGIVTARGEAGLTVRVVQSFGNCPRYIRPREVSFAPDSAPRRRGIVGLFRGLDDEARRAIASAETCFVASYVDEGRRAIDVSHRGGPAGFIGVSGDVLSIPDYNGNRHFNTLGNLLLNPRAGLLFVDFASGDVLQLSGTTEIVFEGPEVQAVPDAERLWRFRIEQTVRRRGALALREA